MRIALDARKVDDYGIGAYIRGLVTAMALARPDCRFVLIGDPVAADRGWPDNVEWLADRSSKYGIGEIFSMSRRAREARADLFHAPHYVYPAGLHCPGVATIHDCIHLRFPEQLPRAGGLLPRRVSAVYARQMIRHAGRSASRVLTVSNASAGDLEALAGLDPDRIQVVYNGCDPMFRRPPTSAELDAASAHVSATPYILFAGNEKPHKNLAGLVRAYSQLTPDRPLELIVAGDGDPLAVNGVRRTGRVSQQALRGLVAGARMVAIPSLYEGFGLPALEAMAAGIPVIASSAGGLPEVVGDAAILVPPGDDDRLADALHLLRDDDDLHRRLARDGVGRAARFTWERAAETTLAVYDEVVAGGVR